MYLDHRNTGRIARILNMVDMSALLLDPNGNVILPEGDQRVFTVPEELLKNPTMPFVYGAMTLIGTGEEQPVYICLHGDTDETKKCAVLCAELINVMIKEDLGQATQDQALRMILRGEAEGSELESMAQEHDIPMRENRCVLYFYFQDMEVDAAMSLMRTTVENTEDLVTEVGHHAIALLKRVNSESGLSEVEEFARAFESSFLTETGTPVYIGISDNREELEDMQAAFSEARNAINVGRLYHPSKHIFTYRSLLLERFLSEVSPEMGQRYYSALFNRSTARLFNDEMVHTIETFFDNSLNLSETARKLYIHRNTLVYRLEKVQNAIGLDLRNFDDAVTFKMTMLLGKGGNSRKFKV